MRSFLLFLPLSFNIILMIYSLKDTQTKHTGLIIWLYCVAGLIALMVVIGGFTRLTDSGLSITQWKPLHGAVPPLSYSDWQEEFSAYQKIPQYHLVNPTMTLDEFKGIFWWEWGHRQLGRLLGLAFFIPMLIFWLRGKIPQDYKPILLGLLFLGGLQGFIGWFMVQSGLTDRVSVSQYRLALHLGFALLLYIFTLHTVHCLQKNISFSFPKNTLSLGLLGLIFLQILSGAFVAGTDSGLIYNTWPLMEGTLIPPDLFPKGLLSAFEDHLTIQFLHRMGAYCIALYGLFISFCLFKNKHIFPALLILGGILIQVFLGILTLITVAPLHHIELAVFHQLGAVILLTIALYITNTTHF